jgi:hypothetical protein
VTDSLDADRPPWYHGPDLGDPSTRSGADVAPEGPQAPPGTDVGPPASADDQGGPGATEGPEAVPDDLACPDCAAAGRPFVASSERGYRSHRTRTHPGPAAAEGGGAAAAGPEGPEETVPGEPPREKFNLRKWLKRDKATTATKTKRERRQWGSGPREPLDEPIGFVYGGAGALIARGKTKFAPVGKVMQLQSGVIGVMADDALKGSLVDKIVQPIVKEGRQFKKVGEAVALPVATAMVIANPEWLGVTVDEQGRIFATGWAWEPYYALWEGMAVQMAHGYEAVEVKKREVNEELSKIPWLQPIIAAGEDPIVYMIVETLGLVPKPQGPGTGEPPVDVATAPVASP